MIEALIYAFLSVFLLFLAINVFLAIAKRVFGSFRNNKVPESTDKTPKVALSEKIPVNNNSPDFNSRKKSRKSAIFLVFLVILILLSLIGGAFYWYELRPAKVRKECQTKVNRFKDELPISVKYYDLVDESKIKQVYEDCLHSKGL